MMKKSAYAFLVCLLGIALLFAASASAGEGDKYDLKLRRATLTLDQFMLSPDRQAPRDLVSQAYAVAVFPGVIKGAIVIGAQYGNGVLCVFDEESRQWSAPSFFEIGGGSLGLQLGGQSSDIILVIMNERGLNAILKGIGTIGAEASVAAGPVGRDATARTDLTLKADIYSYSRAAGLFAGVSLGGAIIAPDNEANEFYYGEPISARQILLQKKVEPKGEAIPLIEAIKKFSGK